MVPKYETPGRFWEMRIIYPIAARAEEPIMNGARRWVRSEAMAMLITRMKAKA